MINSVRKDDLVWMVNESLSVVGPFRVIKTTPRWTELNGCKKSIETGLLSLYEADAIDRATKAHIRKMNYHKRIYERMKNDLK